MDRLQAQVPTGVKWVDPHGIHLTLKFFGNIDSAWKEPVLEAMGDVGRQAAPFDLRLSSLGVFPNERQPRVLWSGVNGDMDALAGLQEEVEQAMLDVGVPAGKAAFQPPFDHRTGAGQRREGSPAADRPSHVGNRLGARGIVDGGLDTLGTEHVDAPRGNL